MAADRALDEARLRRLIEVGRSLVFQLDLETVLRRVLEAARDLTGARYAALGILDSNRERLERFITLGVDQETRRRIGHLPEGRGVLGILINDPKPLRLADVGEHPRSFGFPEHHPPMQTFLGVPILIRGRAYGNLYLTEKRSGHFDEADEESVVILAEWAAIAIENVRSVAEDRLRRTMEASEQERRHWARELHDETLQGLGALRVLLASALRRGSAQGLSRAVSEAVDELAAEIDKLRALITELRPAALDELGLTAAIEALAERSAATGGLEIRSEVTVDGEGESANRLSPEIESMVYRLVQEALTNIVKHARAERVDLRIAAADIAAADGSITVEIRDDGIGFDPAGVTAGLGIAGMRERLAMVGGTLEIVSSPGLGTEIRAKLPVPAASGASL
jgi:two-component system, NarL family, sensor histidine kinase DevS